MTLREVAAQVELSVPTVMAAHRAYQARGWAAVNVKPRGRKQGDGRQLTLTMSANPVVRSELLHYLDALKSAA